MMLVIHDQQIYGNHTALTRHLRTTREQEQTYLSIELMKSTTSQGALAAILLSLEKDTNICPLDSICLHQFGVS
jgi:hypothetical protein